MNEDEETRLVVYTVVVRVPDDFTWWGDVRSIETKHNCWDGDKIVTSTVIEIEKP